MHQLKLWVLPSPHSQGGSIMGKLVAVKRGGRSLPSRGAPRCPVPISLISISSWKQFAATSLRRIVCSLLGSSGDERTTRSCMFSASISADCCCYNSIGEGVF